MTKIKICGLSRPCDIDYVNCALPDYCGFIINFPKSSRNVTPEAVRLLVRALDSRITPVGVFVDQPPALVAELLNDGTISMAQLHGKEDAGYIQALRELTSRPVLQAFQIHSAADLQKAAASVADDILLDSGQGTGIALDWTILHDFPRPFFLAGGLDPENIPVAIAQLSPYAVDLSSGVETDGKKNKEKILAAVLAAQKE